MKQEPGDHFEIELPFDSDKFYNAWTTYKEFLFNEFNIQLKDIQKKHCFTVLKVEAEDDEVKAIAVLEWNTCKKNGTLEIPNTDYDIDTSKYEAPNE